MENNSIIDELYNIHSDKFESKLIKKDDKCYKELDEISKIFDKILGYIDKPQIEEAREEITKIELKIIEFNTNWNRKYYRLGIQDGVKLKKEIY